MSARRSVPLSRRAILSAALSSTALWAGGCQFGRKPKDPLRVVLTPWVGNAPLYIAKERGLFGDVELRIASFGTDFDSWRALADGRADFMTSALFDVLRGVDMGVDLKIAAVVDFSNGADGIVAREGIATVKDLVGKRVGVDVGSLTHFVLVRALDRNGVTPKDVIISNMRMEEAFLALEQGRIDAAPLWEPYLTKAQAAGRQTIFTSRELPGEILDVLSTRRDVAIEHPERTAQLIEGWQRGLQFLKERPDEALPLAARYLSLTVDELKEALGKVYLVDSAESGRLFDRGQVPSIWKTHEITSAFLVENRIVTHSPAAADSFFAPGVIR